MLYHPPSQPWAIIEAVGARWTGLGKEGQMVWKDKAASEKVQGYLTYKKMQPARSLP